MAGLSDAYTTSPWPISTARSGVSCFWRRPRRRPGLRRRPHTDRERRRREHRGRERRPGRSWSSSWTTGPYDYAVLHSSYEDGVRVTVHGLASPTAFDSLPGGRSLDVVGAREIDLPDHRRGVVLGLGGGDRDPIGLLLQQEKTQRRVEDYMPLITYAGPAESSEDHDFDPVGGAIDLRWKPFMPTARELVPSPTRARSIVRVNSPRYRS